MRRALPWGMLALLTAVGLAGTLLGVANHAPSASAQQRISAMFGATRAARTARFRYLSANPLLRSSSQGRGAVNFAADTVTTSADDRQTSLTSSGDGPTESVTQTIRNRQIWIGRSDYLTLGPELPGIGVQWVKVRVPADAVGSLGAFREVDPITQAVSVESVPDVRIEDLGPQFIGTTETTEFQLSAPTCKAQSSGSGPRERVGPTDVWIDQRDRLVQARDVFVVTVPKDFHFPTGLGQSSTAPNPLVGRSTIISSIRLYGFGAPVAIAAPKTVTTASGQAFAVAVGAHHGCAL